MITIFKKQLLCQSLNFFKKYFIFLVFFILFHSNVFAHIVNYYTPVCTQDSTYKVQPNVSSVNNNSNYAWQYKSGNNWVCINEGTNVINGNTYYVTGARYNMTTNPGPIVFTNPNSALNGLQIRCLISDGQGVNPCNMPSGNTWTSNSPFTIDLNNTPCNLTFGFTSPNCTGDKFTWSQTINPLNGNPSIVKLVSGNTNTYTINGGFPSQMTSGPVNLIISQVVSYDGYSTRKSVTQPNERWRMIFQKNGVTIYTSPYTDDVEDFKQQASWTGSLGSKFFAPDGIDKIILEHYDVANGYAGPGSVVPAAICINYETCPSADAGPNKDLNCTTTSTKVGTTAIAGNTYSWSPATGLSSTSIAKPTASPVNTTVYTVTVTSQSGCTATSSVTVSVDRTPPVISIDGVKEVCKNSLTTLTAISNIQNVSYLWNNGANSNKITVGEGTYTVKVTYGVCESTDTAVVEKVQGTIGNFVWNDIDLNGLQNEPQNYGINNISVELWNAGPDLISGTQDDVLEATTTTANDVNNNPGYYNFTVCNSGYYFVKFPANIERMVPTKSNQIAGIDGNSDINKAGYSPVFYIDVHGNGITKDNNTIDAGYFELKYIGDYVWNDLNRNGIQDPNEVGVAGVVVSLLDENNKPIASTITDAYGYYRFDKIYSGNYKVSFTLPSGFVFSPQNAGVDTLTDSDVDPLTGTTNLFSYQAGTIDISRDAGIYLTQVVNATLGDRVWLDMNENGIQDPEEKGMVGITVTLYDENNKIVSFKITDDNGLYSFKDLQPGNYRVGFSLPIGYVFSKPYQGDNEEYDSNPNNSTHLTDIISLSAGETNNTIDAGIYYPRQDLHLPGSIGNFVWNDFNQDGVQQNFEKGIQGVKVILYDETGINALDSTVTDVFGYYIFNNLFEGNYIVQFTDIPEGYVMTTPKQGIDSTLDSDPNPINGKTNIIVLNEGEINTTIDAGLYNPNLSNGAIGDYVWYDRNKNGIQDKGENGVAGVAVSLYDYNDVLIEKTITNNYGYYLFNNVPEGTYYINFSNLPHGYKLTTPNQGGDINLDSNPSVKNGNTEIFTLAQNEINITFDAGIVKDDAMDTKSSLGDKVWNDINHNGIQDIDELGVQGVTVTLYESNGNNVITSTITNALGSYIFTDLDEGDYVVGFSNLPVGYTFTLKNQGGNKDTDSDVDAASNGKTSVINLRKGENNLTIDAGIYLNANLASLGDFVWNDINQNGIQDAGEPGIQGVSVSLLDESGITIANTTTDINGIYQFAGLVPGTYKVKFQNLPNGYIFTVKGDGTIDGTDSDADQSTGETRFVTLTAGENNYNIDAGLFTLKASLGDFVWSDDNENGIQDAGEKGISGIVVTLYDENNTPVSSTVTNAVGLYNFVNLEPGVYKVGFTNIPSIGIFSPKNQGEDTTKDSNVDPVTGKTDFFTLSASQYNPTIDAGIHLPTGSGLGDYVWLDYNQNGIQDENEIGVGGVTVTLLDENENTIRTIVTDQNGAYTFNDIAPGIYKVSFSTLPKFYQSNGNPYATSFTIKNATNDTTIDSDIDPATGMTGEYLIQAGEYNPTIDAGIILATPLPVSDLALFAQLVDRNNAKVIWTTVNEQNSSYFEIYRSKDGKVFEKINKTAASGNTNSKKSYSIEDNISQFENNSYVYYKVKMYDLDGKSYYSNIAKVKIVENGTDIMAYPSPFVNSINISYNAETESEVNIKLYDIKGKSVFEKTANVQIGSNNILLDNLQNLSSGIYSLQIVDVNNGVKSNLKLNKQ